MHFAFWWRAWGLLAAGGVYLGVATIAALFLMQQLGRQHWVPWLFANEWAVYVIPVLLVGMGFGARHRAKALMLRMQFMGCPRCHYDLSKQQPLPDDAESVRCPECGGVFTKDAVRQHWKRCFDYTGPLQGH